MALSLTGEAGGRLLGYPRAKSKSGSNIASGLVTKKGPVLGSKSRIIKIHPSQLVALGGGRVSIYKISYCLVSPLPLWLPLDTSSSMVCSNMVNVQTKSVRPLGSSVNV